MKKILFLICIIITLKGVAQDKSLQASVYYNKAELAYNNGSYDEAISNLKQAENTLGQTNPKILYLLIQALNQSSKSNPSRIAELKLSLAKFFQIVDSKTYPAEKYMDITTIDIELKDRELKLREKEKAEDQFFERVKASVDDNLLESFLNTYPNSKYLPQLRERIDGLQQKKQAQKEAEERINREKAKSVRPNGFYLNIGFALQTLEQLTEGPMAVSFLARGVTLDFGSKSFGYKSEGKNFRVGFDLTIANYTFSMSPKYKYYKFDGFGGYDANRDAAMMHTLQFLKMGPVFSVDLAKGQHYLYVTPQIGGCLLAGSVPNFSGSRGERVNVLSMGASPSLKIEYMYRKLLVGVRYQFNAMVDLEYEDVIGSHQFIIPTIGIKF